MSDEEFVFDCTFAAPTIARQRDRTTGRVSHSEWQDGPHQVGEISERDGVRVFAGARWDPFIMDAPAALKTIETGQLAFQDTSSIYLDGKNVLSIVLEIDCAKLLGGVGPRRGGRRNAGREEVVEFRFERTGRPEVKNMLLAPKQFDQVNRDLEIRDLYNSEDAFRLADTYRGRLPGPAERQPRLLGQPRRQGGLAERREWRSSPHRADSGRLPRRRSFPALRRARLISRNRDGQSSGALPCDLRWPQHQRRCHGHALHAVGEWRQRAPSPRWRRPGNEARSDGVSLPGIPQSESSPRSPRSIERRGPHEPRLDPTRRRTGA